MTALLDGVGRQQGPLRLDWGPTWADLKCDQCGATWVGQIDDPCSWCQRSLELARMYQRDLLLKPPDADPSDATYPARMIAWAERLDRGVQAELINQRDAEAALRRATP